MCNLVWPALCFLLGFLCTAAVERINKPTNLKAGRFRCLRPNHKDCIAYSLLVRLRKIRYKIFKYSYQRFVFSTFEKSCLRPL